LFLPSLGLAQTGQPTEHKHEETQRQHSHHLPLSGSEHSHSAKVSTEVDQPAVAYVRITSNNTTAFDREVGSYAKYDTADDTTLVQITFRSKNLETNAVVLGIAEVPVSSCENNIMGKIYIAYDDLKEGKWHTFEKDSSESHLLKFEENICSVLKS